jgi:hypothetical protein
MMENPHSTYPHQVSGGLICLQARPTNPIALLGATWAMACGVVASGGFTWQGEDWLRLALLVLLVDGGWGTLWGALGSTDWAKPLRRWRNWRFGDPVAVPPYTLPDTPGDRASLWLGQLRAWWRDILWPACGPAVSTVVIALPVTGVLAVLLGAEFLLLSLTALAVMQLSLKWKSLDAAIVVTLPWLAGHLAFGSLGVSMADLVVSSAVLALTFALSWAATWRAGSRWGAALMVGGQLLAAGLLIVLHRPLAAALLSLFLVPQLGLLPWLRRGQSVPWYGRHTRPWLMAAMVVAAWAL